MKRFRITLSVLLAAAMLPAAATAAAAGPGAAHAHDEAHGTQLRLDHGRKWATDAPLREGMARVRALVAPRIEGAHRGTMSTAEYAALASQVEAEAGRIVSECKLPPEADAVLHVLLAGLLEGTGTMAGRTAGKAPQDGLARVVAAVNDYGRYFEHPGWKPIRTKH